MDFMVFHQIILLVVKKEKRAICEIGRKNFIHKNYDF